MHLGRQYKITQFLGWTRWEAAYLIGWSLVVTAFLQFSHWNFLTIPAPILALIGSALAIILAFKNSQCYARFNEALTFSGQLTTNSLILANKLASTVGCLDAPDSRPRMREIFYRHFAWLTAMRFFLRDRKTWENVFDPGNARFLAKLPAPENQSTLKEELKTYLSEAELQKVFAHPGDKEALILHWQHEAICDLSNKKLISELMFVVLTGLLDDLARLQGGLKRIKNYPYARNYYSIAVILVKIFVVMVPFSLFPYAQELGKSAGIEHWTVWLNIPFSAVVGWIFVSLEKVGENSSNPFEGGSNDVPISSIARRIEIEMRIMLGEQTDLKPIEAKSEILF
ncbi:MAG TPA: bestrophin family ion channel [Xanthobacteraceae bacterium]|nr:bestrophin family ion channel [Xanthobacteraceae bacterium]